MTQSKHKVTSKRSVQTKQTAKHVRWQAGKPIAHSHSHTHSLTHTYTLMLTHSLTHTHTHSLTHTHIDMQ